MHGAGAHVLDRATVAGANLEMIMVPCEMEERFEETPLFSVHQFREQEMKRILCMKSVPHGSIDEELLACAPDLGLEELCPRRPGTATSLHPLLSMRPIEAGERSIDRRGDQQVTRNYRLHRSTETPSGFPSNEQEADSIPIGAVLLRVSFFSAERKGVRGSLTTLQCPSETVACLVVSSAIPCSAHLAVRETPSRVHAPRRPDAA